MSQVVTVRLVVAVQVRSAWGRDCTLAQVEKQAIEEAEARLLNSLKDLSGIKVVRSGAVEINTRTRKDEA